MLTLFVESYPQAMYGQQRIMLALLDRWPRGTPHPVVAVPAHGPFVEAVRQQGVETIVLDYPSLLGQYGGAAYRYRRLTRAKFACQVTRYVSRARRMLRERKIEGIFCNDLRGLLTIGLAGRSLGIPVMIWDKLDCPHGWLDRLELPLASRTAFIGEAVKTKFPAWQTRLYRHRTQVIPDGVDLPTLDEARSIRGELGLTEDDIAIGLVGSISARKGQDRLLAILPRLLEQVPNAVLLIVGASSGSEEDARYVAGLPHADHPRVRFLGMRQDVPAIMQSIDLLVAPSRYEGQGLVMVEAMACRKPVAGARAGGIPEVVVHGETGLLFDGDDQGQLLEALIALCHSPRLRRRMGEAARLRVEQKYDRKTQIPKLLAVFFDMLKNEGRRWTP